MLHPTRIHFNMTQKIFHQFTISCSTYILLKSTEFYIHFYFGCMFSCIFIYLYLNVAFFFFPAPSMLLSYVWFVDELRFNIRRTIPSKYIMIINKNCLRFYIHMVIYNFFHSLNRFDKPLKSNKM